MSTETQAQKKVYFERWKYARLLYADTHTLAFDGPRDYCLKVANYENWEILNETPESLIQENTGVLDMVTKLLLQLKEEGGLDCPNTEIDCGGCTSCLLRKWLQWENPKGGKMIRKGTRLQNKFSEDQATVLHVQDKEVTIIVDGYAASNVYELNELVQNWKVMEGE